MQNRNFPLKSVLEVQFNFSICVSESEFLARSIWVYFRYNFPIVQCLHLLPFSMTLNSWTARKELFLKKCNLYSREFVFVSISSNLWGQICWNRTQPIPFGGGSQMDEQFFSSAITANTFGKELQSGITLFSSILSPAITANTIPAFSAHFGWTKRLIREEHHACSVFAPLCRVPA